MSVFTLVGLLLVSCETGRNEFDISEHVQDTTVWEFNDGYGVIHLIEPHGISATNKESSSIYILDQIISHYIAEIEGFRESSSMHGKYGSIISEGLSKIPVQKFENGALKIGEHDAGRFKMKAMLYTFRLGEEVVHPGIVIWSISQTTMIQVMGSKPKGYKSDSFQFSGFVGMNPRGSFSPENFHHGKFAMTCDFENGIGNIDATVGKLAKLKGDFSIDTEVGVFSGDDLVLTTGISTAKASIRGSFHGKDSGGVTGVFF